MKLAIPRTTLSCKMHPFIFDSSIANEATSATPTKSLCILPIPECGSATPQRTSTKQKSHYRTTTNSTVITSAQLHNGLSLANFKDKSCKLAPIRGWDMIPRRLPPISSLVVKYSCSHCNRYYYRKDGLQRYSVLNSWAYYKLNIY